LFLFLLPPVWLEIKNKILFLKIKENIYSEIHYTTKKAKENKKIRDRVSLV